MKKWLLVSPIILLVVTLVWGSASIPKVVMANPGSEYTFTLDGNQMTFDESPQLIDSTMMVPLRKIAEAMGATVTWDPQARTIYAVKDGASVFLTIGNTSAQLNQQPMKLASPPVIMGQTTLIPLRFFSEAFGSIVKWDGILKKISIDNGANTLPVVGTYEKLKELLQENSQQFNSGHKGLSAMRATEQAQTGSTSDSLNATNDTAASAPKAMEKSIASNPDFSTTNVQVQGVDEADVVKTDGKYIYQVNKHRIVIAEAIPAKEMKIISILPFNHKQFTPLEIYVDEKHLVVIGSSYNKFINGQEIQSGSTSKMMIMPDRGYSSVKAIVYDIQSKAAIKKIREVEVEGNYITSRKIGSNLYLLANQYVNHYQILKGTNESGTGSASGTGTGTDEVPAPTFRDSATSDKSTSIGYDQIRYFPQYVQSNYLMIAGLNLDRPEQKVNISTYLGAGENVYVSQSNLYITLTQHQPMNNMSTQYENNSTIYKFLLQQGQVRFVGSGKVPGTVLNQYSMDESNGYFRIATTSGDMWRTDENTSKNNIYILNEALSITGQIEGLAPGEKIYSARFIGKRGYLVTFKSVDPLFVLDLANPQSPKVLGALKIPGYSDYLHPYDENHIIGFGKDAIELSTQNGGTTGFYQGMKIALFNVSDVSKPIELFKQSIGDRGTDSELLRNPKALLFSKEKNLLAFPITLMEVKAGATNTTGTIRSNPEYGLFTFQGAYVYNLDLTKGFTLKGKITHMTADDIAKSGNFGYNSDKNVERILTIGSVLYTLSNGEIRANEISNLTPIQSLIIPAK